MLRSVGVPRKAGTARPLRRESGGRIDSAEGAGGARPLAYNRPIPRAADSAARTIGRLRTRAGELRRRGAAVARNGSSPARRQATADLTFDADELESRLVWLWGAPRTGSTWLLSLLCHPLRPDPHHPVGFRAPRRLERPLEAVPVDESFIPNHFAPALGDPTEVDGRYLPGTLNNYLGGKPAYFLSEEYANVWRPELRRVALVRLNAVLERARRDGLPVSAGARMVIKEGNGSHASDLVMSLLPRARMIFLVRDGRDVVDSLMHAYAPGGFLARDQGRAFETPEERLDGVRWAARMWALNVDVTLAALDAHSDELGRIVRYEDLLGDTADELRLLLQWLGLEREAEVVDRAVAERAFSALPAGARGERERNRAATPGLWRRNLSDEEQVAMLEIMGSRLAALGYED